MLINKISFYNLIIFFGFSSVYLSQVFSQYAPTVKYIFYFLFFLGSFITLFLKSKKEELIRFVLCVFYFSTLIFLGGMTGANSPVNNIERMFFYFSIILGMLFSNNIYFFLKILKIFIVINLIAMASEFVTQTFILKPTSDLDLFTGRAKGLISYSKEAGGFILVYTLLFIKNLDRKWFPILLCFSILTGSRLAIIIVFLAIVVEIFSRLKVRDFITIKTIVFGAFTISLTLFLLNYYINSQQSEIIITRLYSSFEADHSSNVQRIGYWREYLAVYSDYSIYELIFGNPGQAAVIVKNGAESAYLNLLTDGGILAVIIYLFGIFVVFFNRKVSFSSIILVSLLLASMQITRVNIGFLDGVLLWTYFWYVVKNKRRINTLSSFNGTQ